MLETSPTIFSTLFSVQSPLCHSCPIVYIPLAGALSTYCILISESIWFWTLDANWTSVVRWIVNVWGVASVGWQAIGWALATVVGWVSLRGVLTNGRAIGTMVSCCSNIATGWPSVMVILASLGWLSLLLDYYHSTPLLPLPPNCSPPLKCALSLSSSHQGTFLAGLLYLHSNCYYCYCYYCYY